MSLNMNSYMPVRLFTGAGCVQKNGKEFTKYGKKALIVTGQTSARVSGALKDVTAVLVQNHIDYTLFDDITQNPMLIDCMRAAAVAVRNKCTFVIGIGGGSPLDAAKCAAVLAANPMMTQDDLYSLDWPNHPLPIIAVGTTAGTGSEVTKVSVITVLDGRKKSFHHEDIFPAAAFGDPTYTMSLSPSFTASTGIDALAHATESYFSRNANEISQCYSVRAIRLLLPVLQKLTALPTKNDDEPLLSFEEREALYHGSIYGGLAINLTGTCMPHTMGYLLTEQHEIPHGFACAKFLPAFMKINKDSVPEIYQAFFKETGTTPEEFLSIIALLLAGVQVNITEEEIKEANSRWVNNSSILKGWGKILPEMCDNILRNISK